MKIRMTFTFTEEHRKALGCRLRRKVASRTQIVQWIAETVRTDLCAAMRDAGIKDPDQQKFAFATADGQENEGVE